MSEELLEKLINEIVKKLTLKAVFGFLVSLIIITFSSCGLYFALISDIKEIQIDNCIIKRELEKKATTQEVLNQKDQINRIDQRTEKILLTQKTK